MGEDFRGNMIFGWANNSAAAERIKAAGSTIAGGQLLQDVPVHFVGTEGFVKIAVEPVSLQVVVHVLIYGSGEGDGGDVFIDIPYFGE
jgi:hypothetical protein